MAFRLPSKVLAWSRASVEDRDAARRAADGYNLHALARTFGDCHGWVAIRLSDGSSDGVVYDTRPDAIRHQLHEKQCVYVELQAFGISPEDMWITIEYARRVYAAGHRMPDPRHARMPAGVGPHGMQRLRNVPGEAPYLPRADRWR